MSNMDNNSGNLREDLAVIESVIRTRYCKKEATSIVLLRDANGEQAEMFTGTIASMLAVAAMWLGDLLWRGTGNMSLAKALVEPLADSIRMRLRQLQDEAGSVECSEDEDAEPEEEDNPDMLKIAGIVEETLRKTILGGMAKGGREE